MKEFDQKALSEFNGLDGRPVYVAHEGRVFGVSESKMWKGGLHMKRHRAGQDLSRDIHAAPHGPEVFERYPQVGILRQESSERPMPAFVSGLLRRFPLLRRHPHPMMVHFPIVFMFSVFLFNGLFLLSGLEAFETTALHCLAAGVLLTPVAIATGYYTWGLNYLSKPMRPVTIKKNLSLILLFASVAALAWRMWDPAVLSAAGPGRVFYALLTFTLFVITVVIAYFGGQLTFPLED
ncbi:MAG: cytochrome b5 [Deltaproteobacteria bacterium]|nr:cytochrome b5 [Deltaproteobacteria bacterium]